MSRAPQINRRTFLITVSVLGFFSLIMVGGGLHLLYQYLYGARATAHVGECEVRGGYRQRTTHCTGSWIAGGTSLFDGGHLAIGTIDGAETSDAGHEVEVTIDGDEVHTRSLVRPLLFIGLGLTALALIGLRTRTVLATLS